MVVMAADFYAVLRMCDDDLDDLEDFYEDFYEDYYEDIYEDWGMDLTQKHSNACITKILIIR